jgi:hypothetical protein
VLERKEINRRIDAGRRCVLVAPSGLQLDDELLLLRRHVAAPHVRVQVVQPPQPAALPGAVQPCGPEQQHSRRVSRKGEGKKKGEDQAIDHGER